MERLMRLLLCIVIGAALYAFWQVAQAQTVPGVVYSFVGQDNIGKTICKPGYTATIRPSVSYTNGLKKRLMRSQKLTGTLADYELDHMISLELGGSPDSEQNLWMQPYAGTCGARKKDAIETRLHGLVCAGKVSLKTAQHEIRTDWVKSYNRRIGPLECK
jgi:hypothetical protein